MPPENPIKHSDIIQDGNPFEPMIKGLEKALKLVKQMRKEVKATATERVKSLEKITTVTKENKKLIEETAKETKQLTEKDKELLRIEKAIEKEKAKLAVANSKEAKQLAELKERNRAVNAEMRKTIKQQQTGVKTTNTWGKALGSFAAKFNTIGNVAAMAIGKITQGLKRAITQFISFDKIIRSTQISSDRLDIAMGRVEGSIQAINRAISTGNFANIGRLMKDAADAAETYVRAMDELGDTQNALAIQTAKAELAVFKLREIFTDTGQTRAARLKAALEAEQILLDLQAQQERVARENFEAEFKRVQDTFSLQDEQINLYKRFIENFNLLTDEQVEGLIALRTQQDNIKEGSVDLTKQVRSSSSAFTSQADATNVVNNEVEKFNEMASDLSQTLGFDVLPIIDAVIGTTDEQRTAITDATVAYFRQLRTTQTLRNETVRMVSSIKNMKVEEDLLVASVDDLNAELEESIINMSLLIEKQVEANEKAETRRFQTEAERRFREQERREKRKAAEEEIKQEDLKQAKIEATFALANKLTTTFTDIFAAQKEKELSAAGDNAKKRAEIEKKFARREQALAISQAIVDGASSILKTKASLGLPAAIPFMIADAAITAAQIGVIASQKFAEGEVDIDGPSHSRGGIAAEIEGGESVINKRSTAKHKSLLEAINANDQTAIANAALENEAFHDVWSNTKKSSALVINRFDPNIKKMLEIMEKTPVFIPEGPRKEYYPGQNKTRFIRG